MVSCLLVLLCTVVLRGSLSRCSWCGWCLTGWLQDLGRTNKTLTGLVCNVCGRCGQLGGRCTIFIARVLSWLHSWWLVGRLRVRRVFRLCGQFPAGCRRQIGRVLSAVCAVLSAPVLI